MRFLKYLTEGNSSWSTLKNIIYERYYTGQPLEKGGTSIGGKEAPAMRAMFSKGMFKPGQKILDYGAGKYARNADYLREKGCEVYAYDPFNGTGVSGWGKGEVSNKRPQGNSFDVGFSAYVVNVVPEHIEREIVRELRMICKRKTYHVTRNKDVFDAAKNALNRQDKTVGTFFVEVFAENDEDRINYENKMIPDERIMQFCLFGYQSSRGFQRIPQLETKGFNLWKDTTGYKIYEK